MENEIQTPSVKSLSIKWGVILGVISVVFFLIMAVAGLQGQSGIQWLGYIPVIIVIYLAHKEFKDSGDGYMSYSQGLGLGTLLVTVSSVISVVFAYVYIKFLDSAYMDTIKDQQAQKMMEQGLSDAEVEKAMEMSSAFMTPEIILIFGLLASVFFGFIISLIVSAITKNSNPATEI